MPAGVLGGDNMMRDLSIDVAKDFFPYPAGRTADDGPFNAQKLLHTLVIPALILAIAANRTLHLSFDGVYTLTASFLEELFGGLVNEGFDAVTLNQHLAVTFKEVGRTRMTRAVDRYITAAEAKQKYQ